MYLLDTNIISYWTRGDPQLIEKIKWKIGLQSESVMDKVSFTSHECYGRRLRWVQCIEDHIIF